uniref:AlNc14C2G353 protein n=1 Tax=Albugo laibachii Nc14 TaxID=890382 RepID=F0VZL5_9STRA|nr:AlNc14C2G353 [Albugo laibachii Nc14]|eukprot:CCA14245.1 AlNc14C2G353 [Albugo laibachii Nc14]
MLETLSPILHKPQDWSFSETHLDWLKETLLVNIRVIENGLDRFHTLQLVVQLIDYHDRL